MGRIRELRARAVNLKVVLLILIVISSSLSLTLGNNISLLLATAPETSSCYDPVADVIPVSANLVPALQNSLICLMFPFTGWLADTVLGRRRAINISLWCCWLGSMLQIASLCLQNGMCGLPVNIAKYGISVVGLLFIMFGSAIALSSIPAYGLDQLGDKSNASVRSFIHWYTWALFVGFAINYANFVTATIYMTDLILGTTLGVFVVNSIVLCLYGCFHDQFGVGNLQKRKNPYKLVYEVLRYAKTTKHAEKRSAFTYWGQETPSRVDFGKVKYGGPFTEEEVENVKTLWRITFVLLSLFGFYIPFYVSYFGVFSIVNSFKGAITTLNGYGSYVVWLWVEQSILVIVPVYEFIIIPMFPKIEYFLLRPLRGIIGCYVLLLIGTVVLLIITTVGYYVSPNTVSCLVISATEVVDFSFLYFTIPIVIVGITSGPRFIFTLEFIISQSPGNMSGMLTGLFWLIQAIYINIGSFIQIPFSVLQLDGPGEVSCTFWILLLNLIIAVVGFIVFLIAVSRYKARMKDDIYDYRKSIEEAYERALEATNSLAENYNSDQEYVLVESIN